MSFDLIAYAKKHRYRVRNLHDGQGVPPTRRRGERRPGGFIGERHDAITCYDGYVDVLGVGRIGWCVLVETRRQLTARLAKLETIGVEITHEGDAEAAGWAPEDRIADVLAALRPHRIRRETRARGFRRAEATQARLAG